MEPNREAPASSSVYPLRSQSIVRDAHDVHPDHKTRKVLLIIILILIAALVVFFAIRAYKAHRDVKFEEWYQEQSWAQAEVLLKELGSGGGESLSLEEAQNIMNKMTVPAPIDSDVQNGTSLDQAQLILKQNAEDQKKEARKEFRNQN